MIERVLRGTSANLEVTFYADETATSADGAVTVTITRADGSALVTGAATTNPSAGKYRYTLAPQALLNHLTVTWTGTFSGVVQTITTEVEIVGKFYLSLSEIRALPNLSDLSKFTTAELVATRAWFEDTFEDYQGVARVPRFARERLNGTGHGSLILSHYPVRSVYSVRAYTTATTYTAYTSTELADLNVSESGVISRSSLGYFTLGNRNLVVEYEHGHDAPTANIREAAKVAIRDKLLGDNVGNRQFSVQTEQGVVRTSLPGPDRPFGIPFVDQVCNQYPKIPALA